MALSVREHVTPRGREIGSQCMYFQCMGRDSPPPLSRSGCPRRPASAPMRPARPAPYTGPAHPGTPARRQDMTLCGAHGFERASGCVSSNSSVTFEKIVSLCRNRPLRGSFLLIWKRILCRKRQGMSFALALEPRRPGSRITSFASSRHADETDVSVQVQGLRPHFSSLFMIL